MLQRGAPSIEPSQNAAPGVANPSQVFRQSRQIARRRFVEATDQQIEKNNLQPAETTIDAVDNAYACVWKVFPKLPDSEALIFLAQLAPAEGALDINPKPQTRRGRTTQLAFELPKGKGKVKLPPQKNKGITRLKAALAQSHGIVSE